MKRFFALFLLICLSFAVCVFADDVKPVTVTLNGEKVDCASYGQEATIVDGRTLVPLRAIFEALGASVEWDGETKTVTSTLGETEISLTIGENKLIKNGEEVGLDVPAMIMNGRTMVPVRAISESFGVDVSWDGENRVVALSETISDNESDREETESLPKTKAYGDFYFGMNIEEAKAAAKGEIKELKVNSADLNTVVLHITDENNEFDDEDWLITGNLDCERIELTFKNDILYSINVIIEHQEYRRDASEVYKEIVDYYNLDQEIKITNVLQKKWIEAQKNDVDASELLEDGKLTEFPKRIEKYDSVNCFLWEKLDGSKKIGYYVSFDITNQWYYQYAAEQETETDFADLLKKYPFGATKQQTTSVFKGTVKDNGSRIDIHNVQDERQFVNDLYHSYFPEKDIYGQGFYCDYISLEYDDAGLDRFYARTKETASVDEASASLNVILNLYGENMAVFHESKKVYEWTDYKYKIYDGTEKTANIFAGLVQVENGNYYCFVSAQPSRENVYSTLDSEGRIIGTDYPHAYGNLYFGMTIEQACEAIGGEYKADTNAFRIDVYDKENAFEHEDKNITGNINFESMSALFDTEKKTLCKVSAVSSEISSEQVQTLLESLHEYYGEDDGAKEILGATLYSWALRGKNANVDFAVKKSENGYVCTYSITLAGSRLAQI